MITIHQGDCLAVLRTLTDASIDAIVTDPPYGLADHQASTIADAMHEWATGNREHVPDGKGFMGQDWDRFVPPPAVWDECLRVLKPGGHMLVFAGTRTVDLMGLSIRLAGFEIRDSITWMYGSGFPKSLDVSKAIDKANGRVGAVLLELKARLRDAFNAAGATRSDVDRRCGFRASKYLTLPAEGKRPDPWVNILPSADKWMIMRDVLGVGAELDGLFDQAEREVLTTERRMNEPSGIVSVGQGERVEIVRDITAPATDAARQWSGWGTALKPSSEPIIMARKPLSGTVAANVLAHGTGALNIDACRVGLEGMQTHWEKYRPSGRMGYQGADGERAGGAYNPAGRWPTNVVLDEHAAAELDQQSGTLKSGDVAGSKRHTVGGNGETHGAMTGVIGHSYADTGGASRFFPTFKYQAKAPTRERPKVDVDGKQVGWPTVKPLELMRWLIRLVTPPGGVVLDPFAGTGTTAHAADAEGFSAVLIERDELALRLIAERVADVEHEFVSAPEVELAPESEPTLFDLIAEAYGDDELTALWEAHADEWTDEHTAAVKARLVVDV